MLPLSNHRSDGSDEDEEEPKAPPPAPAGEGFLAGGQSTACRTIRKAIDTDEELLANRFGGNTTACNGYIAVLVAAGTEIYKFLWDEYADWYIEISKRRIGASGDEAAAMQARRTLVYALDTCLRLLHPFMPFITEELWQRLPHNGPSLMIASWPQRDEQPLPVDKEALAQFECLLNLFVCSTN